MREKELRIALVCFGGISLAKRLATNAVSTTGALFKYRRIPCEIVMYDVPTLPMKIDTLLADPSPMTRPFDRAALVRALLAVDTTALSRGERRAVRAALADLDVRERGAFGRLDGHVGLAAATYPERDPLESAL